MKKFLISICVFVIVIVGGLTYAGNYFYNFALARGEKAFLDDDPALGTVQLADDGMTREERRQVRDNWRQVREAEDIYIESNDGLRLRGIFIPGKENTNKTVILAHGYTGTAESMTSYAQYYYDRYGFNILMPDARGHGMSEGDYIGMGWDERLDYLQWIDLMIERIGADSEIMLHGVSMGGATVMMTSGENLPEQVKFIVEDCGYSEVSGLFSYQLNRMFKLPSFPIIPWTSMVTQVRAGYNFNEASSTSQVAKATIPMIFIHGDEDAFVPYEMLFEVSDAANVPKEVITIEGAQHGNAFDVDEQTDEQFVRKAIDKFIHLYM